MHEHNDLREYKPLRRTATSILDPSQVWVIPRRASFSVSVEFHGLQQHFVPLWTFVPLYPLSGTLEPQDPLMLCLCGIPPRSGLG
jgi:hypothetical protein